MQTKTVTILGMCISFLLITTSFSISNTITPGMVKKHRNTISETTCLARVIFHEARGQSSKGKTAVAEVTLNRVMSSEYPDSVCAVMQQPHQYSGIKKHRVRNNPTAQAAWDESKRIASVVLQRRNTVLSRDVLFFHAVTARPAWSRKMQRVARIGGHIFYKKSTNG